jgi:hypothetical protein
MSLARQTKVLIREALTGSGIEVEGSVSLDGDETLWEYLHRSAFWNSRNELISPVLVFDQFEELFTLGDHLPQTDAFLIELADLVENYVPARLFERMEAEGAALDFPHDKQRYKVIVALCDDYVHRLDGMRSTMPSIMRNRCVLKRMGHEQAMEAVLGPGGPQAIVDEKVAHAIVDWVSAAEAGGGGVEVEPAILSLVCRELDRRRRAAGHACIRLEDLRESQTDILSDYYEESFKGLDPKARAFIEDRLITASGFRTAVPLEETTGMGDAIEALMQRRLIRSEERLGIPHIELSHDRLTDVVLASRKDREHREEEARREELREQEARRQAARRDEDTRRLEAKQARWRRRLNAVLAGALVVSLVAVRLP